MRIITADLEADGFYNAWEPEAATRIDTLVLDVDGVITDMSDPVPDFFQAEDVLVFHNGIDYDLRMLRKFWGWDFTVGPDTIQGVPVKHVDTMLLSKLLVPDLMLPKGFAAQWKPAFKGQKLSGPHSLDCWGYRLGIKKPKLVYGDVKNVPYPISVAQATADIEITKALYLHLTEMVKKRGVDLRKAMSVEKKVRYIISEGGTAGVLFDQGLAKRSIQVLDWRMNTLASEVNPLLPARHLPASQVRKPPAKKFKKDGSVSALAVKYFGSLLAETDKGWVVAYPDGAVALAKAELPLASTEPMLIGHSSDIKQYLMQVHRWVPTLYNIKKGEDGRKEQTSPKFHEQGKLCVNLEALGETVEVVRKVVQYLSYRNRRSVIQSKTGSTGWLNHPRLAVDGKLPADADTMGAATFRFTHRVVANVPRVTSAFGAEMRSMFKVPQGYRMVGWDASGLEDRVKAHYCYTMLGGKEYVQKILADGFSVHEENMAAWNLPKAKCKNGHYAMQYNCRAPKLGETLGVPAAKATEYYDAWWDNNEPLRLFQLKANAVWVQYNKKHLPGIDGRLVPCTAEYMTTSRLFQSAGVIAMKYAMVLWWNRVQELKLDAVQVIHMHDEAQACVREDLVDEVGALGCWSIKRAGEILGMNVELKAEYDVGSTWKDTH